MLAKFLVILLIVVIFYSLITAAMAMVRFRDEPEKMAKALTWRIVLSLVLFAFIIVSFLFGWVEPKGLFTLPQSQSLETLHKNIKKRQTTSSTTQPNKGEENGI